MNNLNPHYRFADGTGHSPILPVSAFSAYSLLRNCNYLLSSQTQDPHLKSMRSQTIPTELSIQTSLPEDVPSVFSSNVDSEKAFLGLPTKTFLTSSPLFSYPHHHLMLQSDPINSRNPGTTSPCSPHYSSSFSRRQRGEKKPIPEEQKDDKYFERRRRNNQAAKKSRDARKMREDQIALRATILEHENAILRAQVLTLREEASSLRQMLLQKKALELSRDTPICIS